MIKKHLALLCTILALLGLLERHASAQEWVHYQLTNFPGYDQVNECGSVVDTFGNIHHYLACTMGYPNPNPTSRPLYYLRTDFYGHILTDTVRINGPNTVYTALADVSVMGDGNHSWCTFRTEIPGQGRRIGLYLTERDANGNEVLPPTVLDYPCSPGGSAGWGCGAALTTQDSTIHWIGLPSSGSGFRYCRFTTQSETLIWARPIDGTAYGCGNPSLIISPHDNRPWAGLIVAAQDGGYDGIRLVRFNADTSQTVFHPTAAGSELGLYQRGFAMDGSGRVHIVSGPDTAHSAYAILDSTMQQVVEWRTVSQTLDCTPGLKVDSTGNTFLLCGFGAGLSWLNRRADGTWPHPPTLLDPQLQAMDFSILAMDSERFAFTCMCLPFGSGESNQLRLYTYGFPPDTAQNAISPKVAAPHKEETIAAYPNPFSSSLRLELPNGEKRTVVLYDLLGREVWAQAVADGVKNVAVNDPHLAELPSGTYWLSLKGKGDIKPVKITHCK